MSYQFDNSLVSEKVVQGVDAGNLYPHLVCAVDLYRSEMAAQEDQAFIDKTRLCPYDAGLFFSGRFFRVIDLRNPEDYDPHGSITELRKRIEQLNIEGICLLNDNNKVLEQADVDSAFVLTPLSKTELPDLMR